jgi:hypothetical protein
MTDAALRNQLENVQNLRTVAMLVYRLNASGTVTGSTTVVVAPDTTPPGQLMPRLNGLAARLGVTHQHDSPTTFGNYAAVLVTYTLPHLAGKPAEYGAQAYLHGPASTPVITVTTLNAADATATLRQITDTINSANHRPSATFLDRGGRQEKRPGPVDAPLAHGRCGPLKGGNLYHVTRYSYARRGRRCWRAGTVWADVGGHSVRRRQWPGHPRSWFQVR